MPEMLEIMRPMNESTMSSGRDVDQHARGAMSLDLLGEVVLQRQRQLVVHVHLDRHDQELADAQDRDAVHGARVRPSCA